MNFPKLLVLAMTFLFCVVFYNTMACSTSTHSLPNVDVTPEQMMALVDKGLVSYSCLENELDHSADPRMNIELAIDLCIL